jgi:hypothetical protein
MTEYTYHTVGTARFELNGWYSIAELEQLVVDLKECNERYNEVLADSLKEMSHDPQTNNT